MIRLLKTVSVLAVVVAVLGAFSIYGNGRTVDLALAEGHPEESYDPGPEESYDPGPVESYDPGPVESYDPGLDNNACTDCTYVEPPPGGEYFECTDCTYVEPPPGGEYFECTDCTFDQPPPEYYDCADCTFDQPPPEFYECADCIFDYSSFEGEFAFEGEFNLDGGEFQDPTFYEGSFTFDPNGAFIYDGGEYVEGGDNFFPEGEFYESRRSSPALQPDILRGSSKRVRRPDRWLLGRHWPRTLRRHRRQPIGGHVRPR